MALFLLAEDSQTFTSTDVFFMFIENFHANITGDKKLGFCCKRLGRRARLRSGDPV